MAMMQKQFADLVTFTRASGGGRFNAQGQYEWMATNAPRLDYDPVTLQARGLLIEEQRVNLLTYSEQFDNALWVKTGPGALSYQGTGSAAVVTPNYGIAPDGTQTAARVVLNLNGGITSADRSGFYSPLSGLSTSQAYSSTIYIKPLVAATEAQLLASGVGTLAAGASGLTQSITSVGNGWYRLARTLTPNNAVSSWRIQITGGMPVDSMDMLVWGAQLEAGSFPTSYIPTVASQVTRAADVASVNALAPWYNAAEGVFVVDRADLPGLNGYRNLISLGNGSSTDYAFISKANSNYLSGGVQHGPINTPGGQTSSGRTALAYKLGMPLAVANNGSADVGAKVIDHVMAVPSVFRLGRPIHYSGDVFNGHIRSIRYFPKRLSTSDLQALTA